MTITLTLLATNANKCCLVSNSSLSHSYLLKISLVINQQKLGQLNQVYELNLCCSPTLRVAQVRYRTLRTVVEKLLDWVFHQPADKHALDHFSQNRDDIL